MENIIEIPKMTNELGKHWQQPSISEILIDDKFAVMTNNSFKKLKEYSFSNPTGIYTGKMWYSNINNKNYLRFVCPDKNEEGYFFIYSKEILILQ